MVARRAGGERDHQPPGAVIPLEFDLHGGLLIGVVLPTHVQAAVRVALREEVRRREG